MLVLIAHPDDEVFVSGTMCLCAEKGLRLALVAATDGEGGSMRLLHAGETRARLGEIRRHEVMLSSWVLGARDVGFLGLEDVPADEWEGRPWDDRALLQTMASLLQRCKPSLVLCHGPLGGYGHPAHQRVGVSVIRAAQQIGFQGSVFSFCGQLDNAFFSWRFDERSDVRIDAKSFLERRVASLSYHQTEAQFFLGPGRPRTARNYLSALFGLLAPFLEAGRKRISIGTPERFFSKFRYEGLVLQRRPCDGGPHFFAEHFAADPRVRILTRAI